MTLYSIIFIMLIHFLADFGLQTHEQATGKSTNIHQLAYHVMVYSLIWFIAATVIFQDFYLGAIFGGLTFFAHGITDYFTSRIGKTYWDKKDLHNGFVIVGMDQLLHYIQLFLTYQLLVK